MNRWVAILMFGATTAWGQSERPRFNQPPHNYWQRMPRAAFSQFAARLKAGQVRLDQSSEKAFVGSLLKALDISPSSQMLVFSTTSLQLSRISVRNPRALYFNDQTYVGYVPRGQIEVISMDPDMGAVFHIFNIPRTAAPPNKAMRKPNTIWVFLTLPERASGRITSRRCTGSASPPSRG